MESYKKEQPAWQDISIDEIKDFIKNEEIAKALNLARLRYQAIKTTPAEIDAAIANSEGTISAEVWQNERDALVKEIAELEAILRQYQQ